MKITIAPPGRPSGTDKPLPLDKIDLLVEGFARTFALRRAAGWALESPYHVKKWLQQGEEDTKNQIVSDYSRLFLMVGQALSFKANEYIKCLEALPKNGASIMWLLQHCLKEDYGNDSDDYKELLELYKNLLHSYKSLDDKPIRTEANHDRQMDSESD